MKNDQISILIIESEIAAQLQISQLFQSNPYVSSVEFALDTDEALLKIINLNPDLIFLEYPAKGKTGIGIIKFIQSRLPDVILVFVTESKEYAIDAIRSEVYDYLIKPVTKVQTESILEKVQLRRQSNTLLKIKKIDEIIDKKQEGKRLSFNTIKGLIIVRPDDILFCRVTEKYTELHFINKNIEMALVLLTKIEEILAPYNFIRINRSMIINKNYIRKVYLLANIVILSANGEEYEIKGSRSPIMALRKIHKDKV